MLLPANVTCLQVIHTACVWFVWERGMQSQLSIRLSSHCVCFAPGSLCLMRGEPSERSPRCRSHYRRGGATSVLVGFAVRSDGGIGDECVSISVLTHQIVKLLPEIGSPCCGYLPSGRWLGTSHIFLWGDWCRKRRWCSLSFIPIWRACGCGHSCHGQIKYYLASRVSRWTAKRQAGRTLSAV